MTTEQFDELAAEFYRETGTFAPGKDVPPELGDAMTTCARRVIWDRWIAKRAGGLVAATARRTE